MKSNLIICSLLLGGAMALSSCDTENQLANDIQGVWSTSPSDIEMSQPDVADNLKVYTIREVLNYKFDKAENNQGKITTTALLTIDVELPQNQESIVQPLYESLAATATLSGEYTIESGDKITINYNGESFDLQIDPNGRLDQIDYITQQNEVEGSTIAAKYREAIKNAVSAQVLNSLNSGTTLTDIHFTEGKTTMDVKIDGTSSTLSRVMNL